MEIRLINVGMPDQGTTGVLKIGRSHVRSQQVKGVVQTPSPSTVMGRGNRDLLLTAIAKARLWVNDLVEARMTSFAEIAKREGKVARHIRLLAPLAFVSPEMISKIIDGHAPAIGVTALAKQVRYSWAQQRQ
jgi:site-specific DNA recombinase